MQCASSELRPFTPQNIICKTDKLGLLALAFCYSSKTINKQESPRLDRPCPCPCPCMVRAYLKFINWYNIEVLIGWGSQRNSRHQFIVNIEPPSVDRAISLRTPLFKLKLLISDFMTSKDLIQCIIFTIGIRTCMSRRFREEKPKNFVNLFGGGLGGKSNHNPIGSSSSCILLPHFIPELPSPVWSKLSAEFFFSGEILNPIFSGKIGQLTLPSTMYCPPFIT